MCFCQWFFEKFGYNPPQVSSRKFRTAAKHFNFLGASFWETGPLGFFMCKISSFPYYVRRNKRWTHTLQKYTHTHTQKEKLCGDEIKSRSSANIFWPKSMQSVSFCSTSSEEGTKLAAARRRLWGLVFFGRVVHLNNNTSNSRKWVSLISLCVQVCLIRREGRVFAQKLSVIISQVCGDFIDNVISCVLLANWFCNLWENKGE